MPDTNKRCITIKGAKENNLKNLTLELPKNKLIVFTGVSGSGKSSLALDTIAAASRRALNDTFPSFVQQYLPKYGRPHVDSIAHLPIVIDIDQRKPGQNARSTVGTYTDIYSLLRLLFSRFGKPFVGYSDMFSFNHPNGSCPRCHGLGEIDELDIHKLVDFHKSLNDEGVINYITFEPGLWRWKRYAFSGLFDLDKKIKDYSPEELELFLHSPQIKLKNPPANWPKSAKYEGLVNRMYRSVIHSDEGKRHRKILEPMLDSGICPDCAGKRLNETVLSCKIEGKSIADITEMPIIKLKNWMGGSITEALAADVKQAIIHRLSALEEIGLGYLTLARGMDTLSGGEAQRCKIAKYINNSLSDVLYVLDEPSVGLHSHDIHLLKSSIEKLRDNGNTVLLVEHHREMMEAADHIVDLGPDAGAGGGEILYEGDYPGLLASNTLTGRLLNEQIVFKEKVRAPKDWFRLKSAKRHNLKDITVDLPLGVMAVIAGVAGAGKSSLMQCFYEECQDDAVYISQKSIGISLRSTPATYMEVADEIRKIYAKASGASASLFSFNRAGACPVCGGKGIIISEMAFMDSIETACEACGGLRYSDEALQHTVDGLNIAEVMDLSVDAAALRFNGTEIEKRLNPLSKVGLGYLHLNQALSTLSGGELQRMKLASYLDSSGKIFILDEPTDGLHLKDVRNIIDLFAAMVWQGNSIFLVEHSLPVLAAADYVIELGPGGGEAGGELLYTGKPKEIVGCESSITAPYISKLLYPDNSNRN